MMQPPPSASVVDVSASLAVQGLTHADVEANRAGRVSSTQLERLGRVMGAGDGLVRALVGGIAALSIGFAAYHFHRYGHAPIFVLPTIAIVFVGLLYLVYSRSRLPFPREIATAKVSHVRAHVTASMLSSTRGIYDVWLDGARYAGIASSLADDVRLKGRVVDAYVILERKLVVALVPVS